MIISLIIVIIIVAIVIGAIVGVVLSSGSTAKKVHVWKQQGPYTIADQKLIISVWNKETRFLFLHNNKQNIIPPVMDEDPGYLPITRFIWDYNTPVVNNLSSSEFYWDPINKCLDMYLHFSWNGTPWSNNMKTSNLAYVNKKVTGMVPNGMEIKNGVATSTLPNDNKDNTQNLIIRKNIAEDNNAYLNFTNSNKDNITFVEAQIKPGISNSKVTYNHYNLGLDLLGKELVIFMNLYKWYEDSLHQKLLVFSDLNFNNQKDSEGSDNISFFLDNYPTLPGTKNALRISLITDPFASENVPQFKIFIYPLLNLDDAVFNFYYLTNWITKSNPALGITTPLYPVLK